MTIQPVDQDRFLSSLPPQWPEALLPAIQAQVREDGRVIVVLDDDPTGTQTVHGVPVLTAWDVETLSHELADGDGFIFYILTNSRSLAAAQAEALNREIGQNLKEASHRTGREVVVVSRSDSTLRGHFPNEVHALAEGLVQSYDGWLLAPFFEEGGRYTVHDVHWVAEGSRLTPAGQTPYAQDKAFGYANSDLKEWVAEKTQGAVPAEDVATLSIETIRKGGPDQVYQQLMALENGAVCVVNAACYRDLEVVIAGLLQAEADGKRFLYRTAASFVRTRAGLDGRPLLTAAEVAPAETTDRGGGLFIVGSYVPKSTAQLNALLAQENVVGLEADVASLLDSRREETVERTIHAADSALARGATVVIYTSRELLAEDDTDRTLSIGQKISEGLVAIVQGIQERPRYILTKGGITGSDIATHGLGVRRAMVAGQVLPGVPVWRTGAESRYPDLAYIVFPGNVGSDDALVQILERL